MDYAWHIYTNKEEMDRAIVVMEVGLPDHQKAQDDGKDLFEIIRKNVTVDND